MSERKEMKRKGRQKKALASQVDDLSTPGDSGSLSDFRVAPPVFEDTLVLNDHDNDGERSANSIKTTRSVIEWSKQFKALERESLLDPFPTLPDLSYTLHCSPSSIPSQMLF